MVYHLKIKLKNVSKPVVWRRILVPAETPFDLLHQMIQVSFGWLEEHAYAFSPTGYGSSPRIEEEPEPLIDRGKPFIPKQKLLTAYDTRLYEMMKNEGDTFTYTYDFGDDWLHEITLEKTDSLNIAPSALLLGGNGACPPENCGGPAGYKRLKEVLSDRNHHEFEEMKRWLYENYYKMGYDASDDSEDNDYEDYELSVWNPHVYELEYTKEFFDFYFINIYEL